MAQQVSAADVPPASPQPTNAPTDRAETAPSKRQLRTTVLDGPPFPTMPPACSAPLTDAAAQQSRMRFVPPAAQPTRPAAKSPPETDPVVFTWRIVAFSTKRNGAAPSPQSAMPSASSCPAPSNVPRNGCSAVPTGVETATSAASLTVRKANDSPPATRAAKPSQPADVAISRSGSGHRTTQGRPASTPAASAKTADTPPSANADETSVFTDAPSSGVSASDGTSNGSASVFHVPSRRSVRPRSVTSALFPCANAMAFALSASSNRSKTSFPPFSRDPSATRPPKSRTQRFASHPASAPFSRNRPR